MEVYCAADRASETLDFTLHDECYPREDFEAGVEFEKWARREFDLWSQATYIDGDPDVFVKWRLIARSARSLLRRDFTQREFLSRKADLEKTMQAFPRGEFKKITFAPTGEGLYLVTVEHWDRRGVAVVSEELEAARALQARLAFEHKDWAVSLNAPGAEYVTVRLYRRNGELAYQVKSNRFDATAEPGGADAVGVEVARMLAFE